MLDDRRSEFPYARRSENVAAAFIQHWRAHRPLSAFFATLVVPPGCAATACAHACSRVTDDARQRPIHVHTTTNPHPPFFSSTEIGVGLTGFGILFTILGVMMFFDKGLLAMGNILFLSGVALTIGPAATLRFFTRRKNLRGSAAFSAGLMLVIAGWAMIGMAVEAYGFWLLFAGFFPTALAFLRRVPGLGVVLDAPIVKHALNKVAPAQLPV